MSSKRLALLLVIATSAVACANQYEPVSAAAAANLTGRHLATRLQYPPRFSVTGPEILPVGLMGAIVSAEAEDRIVRENAITDPAPRIVRQLADYLRRRYGLQLVSANRTSSSADRSQVAAHAPDDLVLEVWTDQWALLPVQPFPRKRTKYRLEYTAYLRLFDAKTDRFVDGKRGFTLARGRCSYSSKETPSTPTYDEFLADGAMRLIREIDVATSFCIEEFRSKVLASAGS